MSWIDSVAERAEVGAIRVGGGADEASIARAEAELGILPADYRLFVAEFGYVRIRSNELYGLGDDVPPYLDVVKMSLAERHDSPGFPASGIVVMNDGGGNLYHLLGSSDRADSTVYVFYHDDPDDIEVVAPSFAEWIIGMLE
jgi:hypothetical protein